MNLTQFTNYSFRILMYVALHNDRPASLKNIAESYGISYNHLKKVASFLIEEGYLETQRGRYGGLLLAKKPEEIGVGEVIRKTEGPLEVFECFAALKNCSCPLLQICRLRALLGDALQAFLAVVDKVTLADLIDQPKELRKSLGIEEIKKESK